MAPDPRNTVIIDGNGYWVTDSNGNPVAWQSGAPPQGATVSSRNVHDTVASRTQQDRGGTAGAVNRAYGTAMERRLGRDRARKVWDTIPHFGRAEQAAEGGIDSVMGALGDMTAQLAGAMGGGQGGGGGGRGAPSLPRVSGPSDAEINAMIANLVTAATSPYAAARTNLAQTRDQNAAGIAAENVASQGQQRAIATQAQQQLAGQQAAQQAQGQAALQPMQQASAGAGQRLEGQGIDASFVRDLLAASTASTQASNQNTTGYMQSLQGLSNQHAQSALAGTQSIAQAGQASLADTFGKVDSSMLGQMAQAEAEARGRGEQYRMDVRQSVDSQNADIAMREASMAADAAASYDPMEQYRTELEIRQQEQQLAMGEQELLGLGGAGSLWDPTQLTRGTSQRAAALFPDDGEAALNWVFDQHAAYDDKGNISYHPQGSPYYNPRAAQDLRADEEELYRALRGTQRERPSQGSRSATGGRGSNYQRVLESRRSAGRR